MRRVLNLVSFCIMAGFQYFKKAGGAANYKRKENKKQLSKNNSDF